MFLFLPWCRFLSAQVEVEPPFSADFLLCVSRDPDLLLSAAGFTTGYVRSVGQESAPSFCVFLSGSKGYEGLGAVPGGRQMVCQV